MAHPVILVSAHGDVPAAVPAMKAGACDFIEKPFTADEILRAVATLSPREAEVLEGLVAGRQDKVIALGLGISPRRVEIHRGNLMAKLDVRSLPEAVRLALAAGLKPGS